MSTKSLNYQSVYTSNLPTLLLVGASFDLPIYYEASDPALTGLSLNIHFASSILGLTLYDSKVADLFGTPTIFDDIDDLDKDERTDRILQFNWVSFAGSFPNVALPVEIAQVKFKLLEFAQVGSLPQSTTIHFTGQASPGYTFSGKNTLIALDYGNSPLTPVTYSLNSNYEISTIVDNILGTSSNETVLSIEPTNKSLSITASTWTGTTSINYVIKATNNGNQIEAKQVDLNSTNMGSILQGGNGDDQLQGKAGWDIFDAGDGNDFIRAGNGRDIISGGAGRDELHGDFGWNTYRSEKDGVSDLIAVKSDHYLVNWIYGKAGNSPNGEKADIIEGLDSIDKIKIIGVDTREITFAANVSAKGVTGIGIYGKGILEALYTGGDLSVAQITQMTSGDASAAAMSNSVNAYGVW